MTLKELLEKRSAIENDMTAIVQGAEQRSEKDLTDDEVKNLAEKRKELDKVNEQIRAMEVLEEADKRRAEERAKVSRSKAESAKGNAELRAFANYIKSGVITEETRTALTTENTAVMIPTEISQQIILGLQGTFEMLGKVDLRITPHAKTFSQPILGGDMTLKRITVGAANDEGSPAIDSIEIKAYDYRLPVIPISLTLLDGSDADIQGAIVALLTEHIARGLSNLATTAGTASDGISALVPQAVVVNASSASAITYADLVDVLAKVKSPHNGQGVASWMMNSATRAALMKVLDGNNRPIFLESTREGEPDRILGRPVVINDNMPDIAAGRVPIIFGDLRKYILRIVQGVKVRVYQEEKYYKDNCIGVQAFVTADGKLIAKQGVYEPVAGLKMKSS